MATSIQTNNLGSDYPATSGMFYRPPAVERRRACVANLVLEAARSSPETVALSAGADSMTFGELAAQSTRLASYLIALGAGPEVPVGLCLERSFDFIVSALAVLLAGEAYLPLDPAWRAARLRAILDDAQARLVISRGSHSKLLAGNATQLVDLDQGADAIQRYRCLAEPVAMTRKKLAYIIYTSGFTG